MNATGAIPKSLPLGIINELVALRDELMAKSPLPPFYPRGAIRFPKASVSTKLCGLINADLKKAKLPDSNPAELFIVGNDGSYFELNDGKWQEMLDYWTASRGKLTPTNYCEHED